MRGRGQALLALVVAGALVGGGVVFDRARPREPAPTTPSGAISGAWLCPHGGGTKDWVVTLEVANPNTIAATIRVTSVLAGKPEPSKEYTVAPESTLAVPAVARGRSASSFVEYFGAWVAVGWIAHAGGDESGVAAEPCAAQTSTSRWFATDGSTTQGHDDYLIVMNPFATQAIFDVVLYRKGFAPVRDGDLTRYPLGPHRSVAFHLNSVALDEVALGAEVDVSRGRVAVSSLNIAGTGGIRSVIGDPEPPASRVFLSAAGDSAGGSVMVTVPGGSQTDISTSSLSSEGSQTAGDLTAQTQPAQSSRVSNLVGPGPNVVDVHADGGGVVASRLIEGPSGDVGATGMSAPPSSGVVVLSTSACDTSVPALAVTDPGTAPVDVTLHVLPEPGGSPPPDTVLRIAPSSVTAAPKSFLAADPLGSVLVSAAGGTVLASGASSSCGRDGLAAFAAATGIAVPANR